MKLMLKIKKQKGQLILALILVMTVALGIGLAAIQRTLVDVSTSTKVEESSRAFSAAEAGIEKYLENPVGCSAETCEVNFSEAGSEATIEGGDLIPLVPAAGSRQEALQYPPLSKEEIAQVWLGNFNSTSNPIPAFYTQNSLDIYWGNSAEDKAAVELTLVYWNGTQYISNKWYLDQTARNPANNFDITAVCGDQRWEVGSNKYQCKKTLDFSSFTNSNTRLMLVRARLLYNSSSQPFAVQAVGNCGTSCSIPPQAKILTSTGISGETQRRVQVFQLEKVVPPYFDYAIFSAGEIRK